MIFNIILDTDSIHLFKKEIKDKTLFWKEISNLSNEGKIKMYTIDNLRMNFNKFERNHIQFLKEIAKNRINCKIVKEEEINDFNRKVKHIKKIFPITKKLDDQWYFFKCFYSSELKINNKILITKDKTMVEELKKAFIKKNIKKKGKFINLTIKNKTKILKRIIYKK